MGKLASRRSIHHASDRCHPTISAKRPVDARIWRTRLVAFIAGLFLCAAEYAAAQQAAPLTATSSLFDGTTAVDPSTLAPLNSSPAGTASATLGTTGPQDPALIAAAQTVTSAGRTAGQFSVSTSGAATYNIPIWTPTGAREIEPHLALRYTSGGPDGPMGPGWSITGISIIARCGKTWASNGGSPAAVALATTDDFCLDGNRLRLVSGTQGIAGSVYQTELANFSQVTAYGVSGNGPAYFIVQGKDGRSYEYGNSTDSQILATAATTPYMWGLNKIRDRQNNNMTVTYNTGTVLSIAKIQYTATPGTSFAAPYEVDFNYVSRTGGTTISRYVAGGAVSQANQLANITVLSSGTIVRKYVLSYAASATTLRPLLQSVQECGGSAGVDCLRPTNISYQAGGAGWSATPVSTGISGQYPYIPVDLNGDGIPDVLYATPSGTNYHWYAKIATTTGFGAQIDTGIVLPTLGNSLQVGNFRGGSTGSQILAPLNNVWTVYSLSGSTFSSQSTGVAWDPNVSMVADWDGDGLPDLVSTTAQSVLVRRNTSVGGGAVSFASTAQTIYTLSNVNDDFGCGSCIALNGQIADFNGDGRTDLMLAAHHDSNTKGGGSDYYLILTSNGFGTAPGALKVGSSLPGTSNYIVDWNGDGCSDIVFQLTVMVSHCDGTFTTLSTSAGVNPVPFLALDWDGDGQTDFLYASGGQWYVQRSTGTGIAAPVLAGVAAPATRSFFPVDQNGDGQPDLAYVDGANSYLVSYLPHAGLLTPPDIATSISDGFGITFSPSYAPITWSNYTKGTTAAFPEADFQGPMYVVSQFVASDGTGGTYTNQFYYWGARLHQQGRGFEGFATARQTDSRNGTFQVTNYRQDFPYTGSVAEMDVYQANLTTLMSKVVNSYTYADLQGTNCTARCFPYVSGTTTSHYEVGGAKNGQLISTDATSYTYDAYGSLTNTAITQTDSDFYAGQAWTTTIANTITNDLTNYCIGRPSRTTTTKTAPGQLAQTRTVDHTIDFVQCRATSEIVEPTSSLLKVTTSFGFDACGNTNSVSVVGLDQAGAAMPARLTSTSYGSRCQFPESVTNALLQQSTTGYNYNLGVKATATDANGISVSWLYDNFGRKTKETRPDSTYTTWAYADCVSTSCWGAADLRFLTSAYLYSSAGTLLRTEQKFYDGLDRVRFEEGNRVLGTWTNIQTTYDALGRKHQAYLPYASSSNGYHQYAYDLANRPTSDTLYTAAGTAYRSIGMGYLGDTSTVTDPRGNTITKVSDLTGKIRRVTDPAPGGTTGYTFDSFGNLVTLVDATNVSSTFGYNIRGFKTSSVDADTGSWTMIPNSLNELVSQTDAKGQVTTFTYDPLGRLSQRVESESSTATQWTYGNTPAAHNIGRLVSVSKPDGYAESYSFDSIGRPLTRVYTEDGVNYQFDIGYNANGTVDTVTYPTSTSGVRWSLKYVYDTYGYLIKTQDAGTGAAFWALNSANDSNLPTNELLGNGVQVVSGYTPHTNEIVTRTEGIGGNLTSLQNLAYAWDLDGNLQQRQDVRQGLTEIFVNDSMNRLRSSTLNGVTNLTVDYDAAGNISNKGDVGTYTYGDAAHKHAVTSAGSWNMSYDANGNMIARAGGSISWYSFNLPQQITFNGSSSQFNYNADHKRWKQVANYAGTTETTHYIGGMLEVMTRGTVTEFRHQIPGGSTTAVYTRRSDGTNSTYYATADHLGSSDLVLDGTGGVLARESFSAFGARRGSNWQGVPTTADYSAFSNTTRQGFTGHEQLDAVSLVHMNGRVYDPYLGRFLSADTVIQSLGSSQSVNPYAYAWNDPLRYVDPSGHSLLDALIGIVAAIFIVGIVAALEWGLLHATLTAATLAFIGGFAGGFFAALSAGGSVSAALSAGLIGGLVGAAFAYTGDLAQAHDWGIGEKVLAHAVVGCGAGVASGGNCGRGAVSAAASEYLGSQVLHGSEGATWGSTEMLSQTVKAALIGGVASRIVGGSFADGFSIGAAGYMFNSALHANGPGPCLRQAGDPLDHNVWIEDQRTGALFYEVREDEGNYTEYFTGFGYSGASGPEGTPQGINNPQFEGRQNFGPIPRGVYSIGDIGRHLIHGAHGDWSAGDSMYLYPSIGNEMYGRDRFWIHGGNYWPEVMDSSAGCLVFSSFIRRMIGFSGTTALIVEH